MASDWPQVPSVVDGVTPFSSDGLNPIINALVARTNSLRTTINGYKGNCGLIYTDTGFAGDYPVGTLLAWDSAQSKYIKAEAVWGNTPRVDGSLAPAESAYIVGVLLSPIDSNAYATILAYGWSTDPTLIAALAGTSPETGLYFLGSDGKAVHGDASDFEIPVYCFTYTSTGKIIFNPKMPEYSGHSHACVRLPFSGWTITANDSYFIATEDYPDALRILGSSISSLSGYSLLANGELLDPGLVNISGTTVTVDTIFANNSDIWLYAIQPMQGRDPLVHTVTVDDNSTILKADNSNGDVLLSVNATPGSTSMYTGSAVVSFDGKTFSTGPVIQGLQAGPGVTVRPATPGVLYLGNSAYDQNQIDLNITNLDGVLFGTGNSRVTYKFPGGVVSSLYGVIRIPHYDGYFDMAPVLNMVFEGSVTVPALAIDITVIPMPTATTNTQAASLTLNTTSKVIPASSYGVISTVLTGLQLSSDAMLSVKITANSPSASLEMVAASLQLLDGNA